MHSRSYYWDYEIDNCIVRMSNSQYLYGYEYLGASARLVITPLTVCTLNTEQAEHYIHVMIIVNS